MECYKRNWIKSWIHSFNDRPNRKYYNAIIALSWHQQWLRFWRGYIDANEVFLLTKFSAFIGKSK